MLSLSKHDNNVVRGFSPACRGGSCCHGELVEPCTLRQAQGDSGDFLRVHHFFPAVIFGASGIKLTDLFIACLSVMVLRFAQGADGNANAAQMNFPMEPFLRESPAGVAAFAGVKKFIAVGGVIPELPVGRSGRTGLHANRAFAAAAFRDGRAAGFERVMG